MLRGYLIADIDNPSAVYRAMTVLSRQHRFERAATNHLYLRYFINGADFMAQYPIKLAFLTWGLLSIFNTLTPVSHGFQLLAYIPLFFLITTLYKWIRGPKKTNPKVYAAYLDKLDNSIIAPDGDSNKLRQVTYPENKDRAVFVNFHAKHIYYLSSLNEWECISYLLKSLRKRFFIGQAYFYWPIARYVYHLRKANESSIEILTSLLKNWLQQTTGKPTLATALTVMSFLMPVQLRASLLDFLKKDPHNGAAFSALNHSEQEKCIAHLMAGDLRSQLMLLVTLMQAKEDRFVDVLKVVITAIKKRKIIKSSLELKQVAAQLIYSLLLQDEYDLEPNSTFYLCCWYGGSANIMDSIIQLTNGQARFLMLNAVMTYIVKNRPENYQSLFINFINEYCNNDATQHYLAIFASVLPINDKQGLNKLKKWVGTIEQQVKNRLIASLIFALHPPVMLPYYGEQRFFREKPYLFGAEVQQILQVFGHHICLAHQGNKEIVDQLTQFRFPFYLINELKNVTNTDDMQSPTFISMNN